MLILTLILAGTKRAAEVQSPFINDVISAVVFVVILFAIGYGIYSKILRQMAINAKNKHHKEPSCLLDGPRVPKKQAELKTANRLADGKLAWQVP